MQQNAHLPEEVGGVPISYFKPRSTGNHIYNASKQPYLKNGTIHLPAVSGFTFGKLEGSEFLVQTHNEFTFGGFGRVFYAGLRNKHSFLYGFNFLMNGAYGRGGSRGFYESLKPKKISAIQQATGGKLIRFGNIFAIKLPWNISTLKCSIAMFRGGELNFKKITNAPVLDTNHTATGQCQEFGRRFWAIYSDAQLTTDCEEQVDLEGLWVLETARFLKSKVLVKS